MMISEKEVEKAAQFIRDNADSLAKAKAERIYLEQYRKSKKAMLIQKATGTIQVRDSFAYAHPEYIELLEGLKAAIEVEERLKWIMIAAQAKIEIWRTQQANARGVIRSHE